MGKILYTVAADHQGNIVNAKDALKGINYVCPQCNSEVILRKSGKIGKNTKRAHFAHKTLTPNCTPETALHFNFKNLVVKRLNEYIQKSEPLNIFWKCEYCDDNHSGNLLKKIKAVEIEYNLNVCRPDIALLDENEKVVAVIEIVVTHKPEQIVVDYYKQNSIILIEIHLNSDEDLINIITKVSYPKHLFFCNNPKCGVCGNFLQKKYLYLIESLYPFCGHYGKIARICVSGRRGHEKCFSTQEFNPREVKIANLNGANIKRRSDKGHSSHYSYLANCCEQCNTYVRARDLFMDYYVPASYGDLKTKTLEIGYNCDACRNQIYTTP